jgi:O-antigen ligase
MGSIIKSIDDRNQTGTVAQNEVLTVNKVLSAILVAVFFFYLMAPPILLSDNIRWYVVLGLGMAVYLLNGEPLTVAGSRLFLSFWVLNFLGAVLALFRTPDVNNNLYLMVGMSISFFSFLLLIPAMSSRSVRKWVLAGMLLAALAWMFYIQDQLKSMAILSNSYYLTGFRVDKNYISLVLALASTALFYFAINWTTTQRLWTILLRLALSAGGFYLIYHIALTYSRSGLLTAGVGFLSVILLYAIRKRAGVTALMLIAVFGLVIYQSVPLMLTLAPRWAGSLELQEFAKRASLIDKTLLIISDNPILGLGMDATKEVYSSRNSTSTRGLPHNQYLKSWAEQGILGLIGYVIWILFAFGKFRKNFFELSLTDQVLMVLFVPFFMMMNFLDLETIVRLMLALMTGIFFSKASRPEKQVRKSQFPR